MDIETCNAIIKIFGENQKLSMRAERRDLLKSVLFDLPRRSSLGWQALYEHEVSFLRELTEHIEPEEIGRRMKIPGSRPYALQLFILMCTFLGARQQRLLELGLAENEAFSEERVEDLVFLVDFWERATRAYRNDGKLLPSEAGDTQPILDEQALADVSSHLREVDEDEFGRIRRMAATVELYEFVVHGEQRDGIFGHGPYPGDAGRTVFFKEFNDLQNDYLPWAGTEVENVYPNIVVAYECDDVQARCDMFGGIVTEPLEFAERLARVAVLTQSNGELQPVVGDDVERVREAAAAAQEELYLKAVDWTPRYRIEYGAYLFANHLKPFFDLAGLDGDVGGRITQACEETAERMVDQLLAEAEIPTVWRHMGTTTGTFFWPIVQA